MLTNISQIVYQLFQKETLEEVSESELRYFIRQYPYSGTGHLLLAKKLQLEGEKRAFEREISVASIYFNNPAWLQFILQDTNGNGSAELHHPSLPGKEYAEVKAPEAQPADEAILVSTNEVYNLPGENDNTTIEQNHQTAEYNVHEQPEISDDIPGDIEDEINESEVDGYETVLTLKAAEEKSLKPEEKEEEELIKHEEEERDPRLETEEEEKEETQSTNSLFYDDGEVFAEFITEETNDELRLNEETLNAPWETEEEDTGENNGHEDEPVSDEELRENFDKRKHLTSEVVAGDRERPEQVNRDTDQVAVEQPGHHVEYSDDQMVDRPDLISFEAQKASQRDPLPEDHEYKTEPGKDTIQDIKTGSEPGVSDNVEVEVKNVSEATPVNSDNSAEVQKLDFDPYYTIDYFASQGIKLKLEDLSKDKLGQQLKSFTEWIRSMKRLPQQVAENSMDETAQHSIRRIAEHSVEEKEVLTESMAEVWIKQGNYEKARQIYRKLSLQNPSKSTYFAAKIDQLKVL